MDMKEVIKPKSKMFRQTVLDRAIGVVSPKRAFERMRYRAATKALTRGYKGADKSRRSTKNSFSGAGSADADTLPYLDALRAESRALLRDAPLASGAINTVVTNTVGTGLVPQSSPDRTALLAIGVTEEQIAEFSRAAEREFKIFALSRGCDASRTQNFVGLQDLVFRSTLESGDVFSIRRIISRPGIRHKLALQIIEADRVDNPIGKHVDTAELSAGVRRDSFGAPLGYYFLKNHPGHTRFVKGRYETDYVPAYYSNGDWQVLHHFSRIRPEQTRGIPYLAPVVEMLKQLSRYTEAEIDAAVISAMFTVFVKTEDGGGLADIVESGETKRPSNDEVKLGNAAIIDLMHDESIEIANPGRPNQAFDPFVQAILRQIGVALEIPFELLIKHFTASYSAAQAAMVEAWKFFRARRRWLTDSFCQPTYEALISECVAAGYINASGFFSNPYIRAAWLGAEWIGPPRGVIDMRKEAEAYKTMEDRQWKTSAEITAELTGGDWDSKASIRAREEDFRRENGLEIKPDTNMKNLEQEKQEKEKGKKDGDES